MASFTFGALDLLAAPFKALIGTSQGEWVPVTTTVDSLYVDGSVVTGDATANREVKLQVVVTADTRLLLAQACEALVSELNAPANLLTVVSDGGLPQVYETFRASQLQRSDDEALNSLRRVYEVSVPARPFVRSAVREQASAAPPGVSVDGMEAPAAGVVMARQIAPQSFAGAGYVATGGPTVDGTVGAVASLLGASVQGSALTATGGTRADVTVSSVPISRVTASSAGVVLVKSTAAYATSADYVTTSWAVVKTTSTVDARSYQAGTEWLDASNVVVRTDWGPALSFSTGSNTSPRAVWQASPRPSTATKARGLLRYIAQATSEAVDVYGLTLQPSTAGTVTPVSTPVHDGSGAVVDSAFTDKGTNVGSYWDMYASQYIYRALPAGLDVSAQPVLRAWFMRGSSDQLLGPPALRLWDSAGNWSRWDFATSIPASTWTLLAADLASPTDTSTSPCDPSDVVGWDLLSSQNLAVVSSTMPALSMASYLDTLTAGPADAPNLTPRGTVLALDGIKGSARSTASVVLTNTVAMTDWLVASIDGTSGDPLLVVTSNAATGTGYDGVYSILVGRTDTSALTNPTLTVTQKIAGTTVATRTLTGNINGKYVDYGAVELPLVDTPAENTGVTYSFALSPSSASYAEVLVVDVDASMAWLPSLSTARKVGMVDEPEALANLGKVWVGDLVDRTDARAPITPPVLSRPLHVQAPGVRLLAYSTTGAPSATVYYWPRYVAEPTS